MVLPFGIDIFSFVPALGAAALSLKNWLELRQGAVIYPTPILNYGIWGINAQESKNKVLILPIMASNDGSKSGMISNVKVAFDGRELEVRRKIKLKAHSQQEIRNMAVHEFRNKGIEEINPFFPINVHSKEDTSFLIECWDGNNVIELNKSLTCSITVEFGNNQFRTVKFPFSLTEKDFEND
jgi:hypothetical protein